MKCKHFFVKGRCEKCYKDTNSEDSISSEEEANEHKICMENHAIVLEMLHTLAEHQGVYFQPKEDGSYDLIEIDE